MRPVIWRRRAEVARRAHNPEVVGSIPTVRNQVATKYAMPKTNKTFSGEDARTHSGWCRRSINSYTTVGAETINPLRVVVLHTDFSVFSTTTSLTFSY